MRILIDGRPLQGPTGRRGVGRYVRHLLLGLSGLADSPELAALVDPRGPGPELPRGVGSIDAFAPPGPAVLWGRVLGPRWIGSAHADAWHATFLAPPRTPGGMPWVSTIHDLIPLSHPRSFTWRQRAVFATSLAAAARADRVIAVSRHTAEQVHARFDVPWSRLAVVPPPIDTEAFATPPARGLAGQAAPYLLHLGGFDPKKGVADILLPAFARLATARPGLVLVLTGAGAGRAVAERVAADLGVTPRVVFAGHLDDASHAAAIAGALAVVVPSREEGFGMPVAEALAAGVPVAVGPAAASREAAGPLGDLAADDSPAAFARAIEAALARGGAAGSEGDERRAYARRFDRAVVAAAVLEIYRDVRSAR